MLDKKVLFDISRNMVKIPKIFYDKIFISSIIVLTLVALIFPEKHILIILYKKILTIMPFFIISLLLAAFLTASHSIVLIRFFFTKYPKCSFFLAPIIATITPFCSCTAFPIIITLIKNGISLSPIMAFLISAPVIDVQMALLSYVMLGAKITFSILGSTIIVGWLTGFLFSLKLPFLLSPLKEQTISTCYHNKTEKLKLFFWCDKKTYKLFWQTIETQGLLIGKWWLLAIVVSVIFPEMNVSYLQTLISTLHFFSIPLITLIAIPTYINNISSTFLASVLLESGIPSYAIITYMLAGGMSCFSGLILFSSMFKWHVTIFFYTIALLFSMIFGFLFYIVSYTV